MTSVSASRPPLLPTFFIARMMSSTIFVLSSSSEAVGWYRNRIKGQNDVAGQAGIKMEDEQQSPFEAFDE